MGPDLQTARVFWHIIAAVWGGANGFYSKIEGDRCALPARIQGNRQKGRSENGVAPRNRVGVNCLMPYAPRINDLEIHDD